MEAAFPSTPVVITGAGGWVGRAAVEWTCRASEAHRLRLFGSRAGELATMCGSRLPIRPLSELARHDVEGALVLHLAFLTREKAGLLGEPEFLRVNQAIDDMVLAALEGGECRGVFVASSGAAVQAERGPGRDVYGLAKLMQEHRFLRWGAAAGVPVLAGRIFNIAGPYMNKLESYALSSFLTQAAAEGRICIQASTPVFRSYLHVLDLCEIVLRTLSAGVAPPMPVDLCGTLVTEMADVARSAAAAAGLPEAVIERAPVDWSRPSAYLGEPAVALALAGATGVRLRSFEQQVADTARHLGVGAQLAVDTCRAAE